MFETMQLSEEIKYTLEVLILLSFVCGMLCGYLWSEHKNAHKINKTNDEALEKK